MSRSVAVATSVAVAIGSFIYLDAQHTYDVTTEHFVFESGGNQLAATLALPTDAKPVGLAVFIHGDGPIDAANQDIGYWPMWEALADVGWASVSWDKPGVGSSSGNWLDQTMTDRATEAVDAIASLEDRPDIETDHVGLIGFSQAGWVLPLVANTVPIEFVIAGSPAINWLDQGRYLTNGQLTNDNAPDHLRRQVIAADETGRNLADSNAPYGEYLDWHKQLAPGTARYFGEMSAERWQFVVNNHRADATNDLASMADTPVLLLLAGNDKNVDIDDTEAGYRRLLSEGCLIVETYPDADHSLVDGEGAGLLLTGIFAPRTIFADGLLSDIRWFAARRKNC